MTRTLSAIASERRLLTRSDLSSIVKHGHEPLPSEETQASAIPYAELGSKRRLRLTPRLGAVCDHYVIAAHGSKEAG